MSNPETKPPTLLNSTERDRLLSELNYPWKISNDGKEIICQFDFKGFYKTMGFVNAVAWIAQQEMHHPDMEVSFNKCIVHFTTHDSGGLTDNDFRCARLIESLNP
ncbi:MAG: 4a-hydroxytetrahydrobiopterin dehydratase [Bdellovibrionales bacterium]|nr:4a-hydroxytetrahydrobiopterin dehydratase [Bdellovibrionales bacterium]